MTAPKPVAVPRDLKPGDVVVCDDRSEHTCQPVEGGSCYDSSGNLWTASTPTAQTGQWFDMRGRVLTWSGTIRVIRIERIASAKPKKANETPRHRPSFAERHAVSTAKTIKPINATNDQLMCIRRDNIDSGDYWCLTDGYSVTFCHQESECAPKQKITMPIKDARRLIAFLTRPYRMQPKKGTP